MYKNIGDIIILSRPLTFTVDVKRLGFFPTIELRILGFSINSNKVEVYLSGAKNNEVLKLLQNARKKSYIKIRKLAKLVGKLTALFPE